MTTKLAIGYEKKFNYTSTLMTSVLISLEDEVIDILYKQGIFGC